MRGLWRSTGVPLALAALLMSSVAQAAEPPVVEGTVVQIERDTAYFDLGARGGLRVGSVLAVLRTVTAQHPVTHATLVDHFPIGVLRVDRVGQTLSYGKVDKKIVGVVKVGDVVRLAAAPSQDAVIPMTPPARGASRPAAPANAVEAARAVDPETEAANQLWRQNLGQPLDGRIARTSTFLATHPKSPFAESLNRELTTLRALSSELVAAREAVEAARADREELAAEAEESVQRKRLRLEVLGQVPERLYQGDPLDFAILVENASEVTAAFAWLRRPDDTGYTRVVLTPSGDGYFRGRAPAAMVIPPALLTFIEVWDAQGRPLTAGTAERPRRVEVEMLPPTSHAAEAGHTSVRGFFEYVDFNRLRGNDFYYLAEGEVTYRMDSWFYAVRTGFGVLAGRGGKVEDLDKNDLHTGLTPCDPKAATADPTCGREVGFNYGYVEAELHFGRYVGVAGRFLGGQAVTRPGVGAELRLRFGQETGTNLLLGASVLRDIGALGVLQLEWNVIRGWPMAAAVSVTNQPVQEDIGVRIVYQLAYRAKPWLQPAIRIGYDVRNVNHGGPSFGVGLLGSW